MKITGRNIIGNITDLISENKAVPYERLGTPSDPFHAAAQRKKQKLQANHSILIGLALKFPHYRYS